MILMELVHRPNQKSQIVFNENILILSYSMTLGGEPIKVDEYYETGQVTEFRYCMKVGEGVKNGFFNLPNFYDPVSIRVINLGSDTFGNFLKGLTKVAILLDYKCPRMLCLALPPHRKVWKLDFQSHPNLYDFFCSQKK